MPKAASKKSPPARPASGQPASRRKLEASKPPERKSGMLHIRLDDDLRAEAAKTFEAIGISLPEAIRVFLKRTVRMQAFPFALEVPNAETLAALAESRGGLRFTTPGDAFDALDKGQV